MSRELGERATRDRHGRLHYIPLPGDVVVLRRPHPCGSERMVVTLVGIDVRLSCTGCGARLLLPRQRLSSRVRDVACTLAAPGPDDATP